MHVEAVLEVHFILTARQMVVLAVRDIGVVIADTIAVLLAEAAWEALAEMLQMKEMHPTAEAGSIFMGPCTLPVAAVARIPMVLGLAAMVEEATERSGQALPGVLAVQTLEAGVVVVRAAVPLVVRAGLEK